MYGDDREAGGYRAGGAEIGYGRGGRGYGSGGFGSGYGSDRYASRYAGYTEDMSSRRGWEDGAAREMRAQTGPYAGRGPKGYERSDERIREDVCDRFTRHGYLDASDIEVRVEKGEVFLTGTVDSREAKHLAEDLAEECSGVRNVQNQLRLSHAPQRDSRRAASPRSGNGKASERAASDER
jgi:osmotically-inducible protein OsmY